MDVWLLLCVLFVALATFEYAILLSIRFGKGKKRNVKASREGKQEKCYKMDNMSLRMFVGIYILAVATYFYLVKIHRL